MDGGFGLCGITGAPPSAEMIRCIASIARTSAGRANSVSKGAEGQPAEPTHKHLSDRLISWQPIVADDDVRRESAHAECVEKGDDCGGPEVPSHSPLPDLCCAGIS